MSDLLLIVGLALVVCGLWLFAPWLALVVGGVVVCAYGVAWESRRRKRIEQLSRRGGNVN